MPTTHRAIFLNVSTCLLLATGCGSTTEQAASPEGAPSSSATGEAGAASPAAAPSPAQEATPAVVTSCEPKDGVCLPPASFVKKLCANVNPDLALVYFKQGSPFTRAYLTRKTDAWNASRGASSQDKLVFDEEVIVVAVRKNTTGIEVSGAGQKNVDFITDVTSRDLPFPRARELVVHEFEKRYVERVLERHGGSVA